MIKRIKRKIKELLTTKEDMNDIVLSAIANTHTRINDMYWNIWPVVKENQSLCGRIKILEEQHDIMHNFLVEINKYLVMITDKESKMTYQKMSDKGKRSTKNENNEGRTEKRADMGLKDKKYKNQYKEQKGMK